jgi:hypothetical protein
MIPDCSSRPRRLKVTADIDATVVGGVSPEASTTGQASRRWLDLPDTEANANASGRAALIPGWSLKRRF